MTHSNEATALAHANIALIKYWGKRDLRLNLPAVGSLSITLDSLWTRTRVRFEEALDADQFSLNGVAKPDEVSRVAKCLALLRAQAGATRYARVESENNFPTGAGLASSASGFAALVVAAAAALNISAPASKLSEFARRGSGSASRSLFGGFVEWSKGVREDGQDSIASPLLAADQWPLSVVVAVTSKQAKTIGSTEGMNRTADSSPYYGAWVDSGEADLNEARAAILAKDFERLAAISEYSCLKMHALALAARPGLIYVNGATVDAMHAVRGLRASGVPVFFTVDAGPQLKAVCLPEAVDAVRRCLKDIRGVLDIIETGLGAGARLVESQADQHA